MWDRGRLLGVLMICSCAPAPSPVERVEEVRASPALPRRITSISGGDRREGPLASVRLNAPWGLLVDDHHRMWFTDSGDNTLRMVDLASAAAQETVVAGTGVKGYGGDGGPAIAASLGQPAGIAIDGRGVVYVADFWNQRIRVVNTSSTRQRVCAIDVGPGQIATIAGDGTAGYRGQGEGGPATQAQISWPTGITLMTSSGSSTASTSRSPPRRS